MEDPVVKESKIPSRTFYDKKQIQSLPIKEGRSTLIDSGKEERDRVGATDKEVYSSDAKIKIYSITGVVCTFLILVIIVAIALLIRRRLPMLINREILDAEDEIGGNKGSLKISEPQDPWTTNEKLKQAYPSMIRSHVWFDSLQRFVFKLCS